MGRLTMVNIWLIRYRDPHFLSKLSTLKMYVSLVVGLVVVACC